MLALDKNRSPRFFCFHFTHEANITCEYVTWPIVKKRCWRATSLASFDRPLGPSGVVRTKSLRIFQGQTLNSRQESQRPTPEFYCAKKINRSIRAVYNCGYRIRANLRMHYRFRRVFGKYPGPLQTTLQCPTLLKVPKKSFFRFRIFVILA